jgi:hypothetical protein
MGFARSKSMHKDILEPQNDGSSENTRLSSHSLALGGACRERGLFFLTLCAKPVQPLRTWLRLFRSRLLEATDEAHKQEGEEYCDMVKIVYSLHAPSNSGQEKAARYPAIAPSRSLFFCSSIPKW